MLYCLLCTDFLTLNFKLSLLPVQFTSEEDPIIWVNFPLLHFRQDDVPTDDWYSPIAQGEHGSTPVLE
jgi:hypothetical protein